MPKPWSADDRPKEWFCPDCRVLIPKGKHESHCSMKLENPTRQQIDDVALEGWKKNVGYASIHWKRKIEFLAETLEISRNTAALFFILDNSSMNIQHAIQSLKMDPEMQRQQKEVLGEAHREFKERKKGDKWKGEDDEGEEGGS